MDMPSSGDGPELTVADRKRSLRREILATRRLGFDRDAAARHVLALIPAGGFVAAYLPLPSEPSPELLPVAGLPRLLPSWDLDLVPVGPLQPGLRGTTEPTGPAVPWSRADLVIVPALAASHAGVRLGRGGGSYDRVLARLRPGVPVVAMLALDSEWVASLPSEPHDVRVTRVARPSGLEEVRSSVR